ncbi:MAG: MFS transporter [Candidatus Helarchaeota archaeon]|nr:MFS transporter [Candidatus Helarchaeota archaeon]
MEVSDSQEDVKIKKSKAVKTLTREERRKIREKKRAEEGFPTKMNRYLWFVLFFSSIVSFFDGWGTVAIMLAIAGGGQADIMRFIQQVGNPDLFTYFGISSSPILMGIILSIAGTGVVAAVSFKSLVDKYGRRPLTLVTSIGFITFAVLTAFSPPGPEGLIIFLILRISANYFLSADIFVIIMAEEAPDHLRGNLIGIILALSAFGGVACGIIQMLGIRVPIAGPWGSAMTVWQSLYFLNIVGFIFIIPLFFFLKETKRFKAMKEYEQWRKKKGLKSKTGWAVPLQKQYARPMVLGCVAGFLMYLIYFGQVTFFGLYFAKELKMSQQTIGLATLPIMGAGTIAALITGPILDRWGRIRSIEAGSYILIVGIAFYSFPTVFVSGDIPNPILQFLVVIGGVLGAISVIIAMGGVVIMPLEMLPTHIRSTAMGWISAINRASVIVAPFLIMYGAEELGGLGLSYQYIFILMLIAALTAMYTIYMLAPEGKGRTLEEIVATEVYTKKERVRDEKYKRKYYVFLIGLFSFIGMGLIYGQTTNAPFTNVLIMLGVYSLMSLICFALIFYVREKIM